MPHPLDGGPAFRVCAEAILDEVSWQANVAAVGAPLMVHVLQLGFTGTFEAYENRLEKWARIQWAGEWLLKAAADEEEIRAFLLRRQRDLNELAKAASR